MASHQRSFEAPTAELAGDSPAMRRVRDLIAQVAPSTHAVLLRGEPGVGKSRAARAIHQGSTRATGPFVALSSAAMPETDVDDQLFGAGWDHADTGVSAGGCVGRSHGGTLFIDEIAGLGPLAQRRLLLLAVPGAGQGGPDRPEVRLVAATSVDMEGRVASGAMAAELFRQLSAVSIALPPLRERPSDIPVLTDLFVEHGSRDHARRVSRVSDRAMDMLMRYDWPGNVSQLRRTIERAVVLTTGPVVHHHHLPIDVQEAGGRQVAAVGLAEALGAYEKELLEEALRRARGVRSQAARLLMTSERMLGYRLRKHGIDSRHFRGS